MSGEPDARREPAADGEPAAPETPARPRSGPAPMYGEYATPEEVAAITGVPLRHAIPPLRPAYPDPAAEHRTVATDAPAPRAEDRVEARRIRPLWDRALTVALLVTGAWTGFGYLLDSRQFGAALQAVADSSGFTGDVIDGTIDRIGQAIGPGLLVIVALSVVMTVFAARRHVRVLFWIPLIGLLLSVVGLVVAYGVAFEHLPGLLAAIRR